MIKNKSVPFYFYEDLSKCSKCGFCQAFCPVYAVTGIEPMAARGRNAQIMGFIEGRLSISEIEDALSSCLLCMGCVPSCFPGVRTDEIVRAGREALIDAKGGGILKEIVFNIILPYPARMTLLLKMLLFFKTTGLIRMAEKMRIVPESLKKIDILLEGAPKRSLRFRPSPSGGRSKAAYFKSCGFNYLLSDTGDATIKLIERLGYEVVIPDNICCGLPPYAHGYTDAAGEMAKRNIDSLERYEIILTECGSCSSFLKKYAGILSDDPVYAERAKKLSERVIDSNEFIFKQLKNLNIGQPRGAAPPPHSSPLTPNGIRVTYHDPCHLSRYQGVVREPREMIRSIPGIEFVELPEADWCCGGAGAYSTTNSDISERILDRKMANVKKTGADILVTSCPSCMIHLSYGVRRSGLNVKVMHVNQLLVQSMA